jgi:ABC-2 type transport system permease protein/sodium transport system permease protein
MSTGFPAPMSAGAQLGRTIRLARKELTEILRDRRTTLTLVLMPVLLYPLLAIAFSQLRVLNPSGEVELSYRLGFRTEEEAMAIRDYLSRGEQVLLQAGVLAMDPGQAASSDDSSLALLRPDLKYFGPLDPEETVRSGEVDIAIQARPNGFRWDPSRELAVEWEILYRNDSVLSREAVRHVERLCAAANQRFLGERLHFVGVPQRSSPVETLPRALDMGGKKASSLLTLVPLVLILMTITGAVYPAIDLTAGERERGTLEILIAAPIPRLSLLFAKYVAVVTVSLLTAVVNLGMMTLTLKISGLGHTLFGPEGLSLLVLVEVFGLLLLFAAFFSALLLVLTSFARSFKEAQAYLIPLMLLALLPGMLSLVPGLPLDGVLLIVPLLNIVLLARDLLTGHAHLATASIVVLVTLTYALGAIAVAARIFGAEAVLYNQPGFRFSAFGFGQKPRNAAGESP